jgi:hypothetical protein
LLNVKITALKSFIKPDQIQKSQSPTSLPTPGGMSPGVNVIKRFSMLPALSKK